MYQILKPLLQTHHRADIYSCEVCTVRTYKELSKLKSLTSKTKYAKTFEKDILQRI